MVWPPDYTVRHSARAQNISLKISANRGLEIVLPIGDRSIDVNALLDRKRAWIEKNADLLRQAGKRSSIDELPQSIYLPFTNEHWQISYLFSPVKIQVVLRPQCELTVLGNIDDSPACFDVLRLWLRQKAEQVLTLHFEALSQEISLPFQRLTIRNQVTRWGSCSAEKNINLNFKLIFLPPEIVRHVMIHELCHTIHLNHSRKFWRLVAQYDPQWQRHHRLSRYAGDQHPVWL